MSDWCDNPREHKREGERDFDRRGRYGMDPEKYDNHSWDDCNRHYREGFDQARREHDDRIEQEQAEELRRLRHAREAREIEQMQEQEQCYPEPCYPEEQFPEQPTSENPT